MAVNEQAVQGKEVVDPDLCWALLKRVIASPQLRRSARMREFLLFVGQRSLKEGADQIHEQEIGSEVFGRRAGYDTSADNIVRVNATDLRRRVDDYFVTDGAHEPLVMVIPRGSYKPVFLARTVAVEPEVEVPRLDFSEPLPPSAEPPKPPRVYVAGAFLIIALTLACVALALQNLQLRRSCVPAEEATLVRSFWTGILGARPNTDVILADTAFALIEDITRKPIPLNAYLNRDYVNSIRSPDLSQDRRDDLNLVVQRSYGSIGDFRVAQRVLRLDPGEKNMRLYYARDYSPAQIKQDNVILIGSRKSNPWVDLFADRLNFTVEYDIGKRLSYVRNRSPRAGEQENYTVPPAPSPSSGYSVVAYLPNPDQAGKVVILAGTGGEATESAGEFLTSEEALTNLRKTLHVNKLPYFEVLLETSHLNGTPMASHVIAYRTYPDPH